VWKILGTDVTLGRADSKVPILGELVTPKGRSKVMEANAGGTYSNFLL
jgi:hypothetical protein